MALSKSIIHQTVARLLESHIENLNNMLSSVTDGAEGEGKSSAGDKHETSAAMLHLEQEKLSKQLQDYLAMRAPLSRLNGEEVHEVIQVGSWVETDRSKFYIAVPLGSFEVEGIKLFAVSPSAPLIQKLLGKKAGDVINFNGVATRIVEVN